MGVERTASEDPQFENERGLEREREVVKSDLYRGVSQKRERKREMES